MADRYQELLKKQLLIEHILKLLGMLEKIIPSDDQPKSQKESSSNPSQPLLYSTTDFGEGVLDCDHGDFSRASFENENEDDSDDSTQFVEFPDFFPGRPISCMIVNPMRVRSADRPWNGTSGGLTWVTLDNDV